MSAVGQVPGIINYQGRLQISGTNYSGTGQFKFALVDATGSSTYWCHGGSSSAGGEPSGAPVSLTLNSGQFSVNLGDLAVPNMAWAIPASVFTNSAVYLRIWVYDPARGAQLLSPDQRVSSVGYAMTAATVLGLVSDSQVSANVARLSANQAFLGANSFAGAVRMTNAANLLAGVHAGDGSGLTNVSATSLTGTLPGAVVEAGMPSGAMLVSATAQDPALAARGYLSVMSVPAPTWVDGGDAVDAPAARTGHTGIWDGQELIIWGGSLGGGTFWVNSGGLYRPDLDAWSLVSMLNPPVPRAGHTAVWSGAEMLVWGGNGAGGPLNNGGRYQPASARWNVISTNGAPAARAGHVAVWAGSRMVIWGGRNSNGLLADGGFYDPAADQWAALTLANPPAARTGATAVWAGDRILMWGGDGANGVLNSGSQMLFVNGVASQWRAMTLANAPAGRRHHTAVWTGQKLIIWGGDDGATALADGAAYDPMADAWDTLPSTNAPAARYNHTAVWTGQEMLILGGSASAGELASTSAYGPATRQWRTVGSGGNAQERTGAAAVWSGAEVLVFGGQAAGAPMAWLQRLNPQPAWYFYRKP